ncbi:MAG TPA: hypothetical protein PKB10_08850 [Tepidisphaeraceae bacterium]|nr:hypothetical protein [Tepidisphaeraceae bacterium]
MIPLEAVHGAILLSAIVVTYVYGSARAFAWVYLPTIILISTVPRYALPISQIPPLTQVTSCMYGILIGIVLRGGEQFAFRWNAIDWLIVALALSRVVTTAITERLWTSGNTLTDVAFNWVAPYLLARHMFADVQARKHALIAGAACCIALVPAALVELRLRPFEYSRVLENLGIIRSSNTFVYHRFGLFRPMLGYAHPIDYGNVGVILAAMLAIFAVTANESLRKPWVLFGICAAAGMAVMSLSFTCHAAILVAAGVAAGLYFFPAARAMMLPGVVLSILLFSLLTFILLGINLDEWKVEDGSFAASFWIRTKIVQNTWAVAEGAGLFGYGRFIPSALDLDSVDNAYMLFVLRFGWVYLALWMALILVFAHHANRALASVSKPMHRLPLIFAFAGVAGTITAMYTVFYGFAYAVLFPQLIAIGNSICQTLLEKRTEVRAVYRGFPIEPPGRRPRGAHPLDPRRPAQLQ